MKRRGFAYMGDSSTSSIGDGAPTTAVRMKSKTAHLGVPLDGGEGTLGIIGILPSNGNDGVGTSIGGDHDDRFNYALLLALYTLQGIPMGLSASIPFLIQQKVQTLASASAAHHATLMADRVQRAGDIRALLVAVLAQAAVGAHRRRLLLEAVRQEEELARARAARRGGAHGGR